MSNIIIFETDDRQVQVRLEGDAVWLRQVPQRFGRERSVLKRQRFEQDAAALAQASRRIGQPAVRLWRRCSGPTC
ncbi:MAG TPA: hypothetical protein PKO41_00315 [Dokdonella sp.]|uniref:hypothetical protein n=1 Tax=Dokdonella sp. TaxID=2291710 RepID=UPI0025C68C1F|nr:hypothetical protein [Dokdonella sp.]MBX3691918.1 hypothetical protein [Dokdonella sp.]HNR90842.1 hypothetical protein [Dokdonella sp.]